MTDKKAKESSLVTLKNVHFVYTSVTWKQEQLNQDKKPPLSDHPEEFYSWEVKIIISRKRFLALREAVGNAKNFPNAKDMSKAKVKADFGIDVEEDEQMMIKFSQACLSGKAIPDPAQPGKTTRKDSRPIELFGVRGKLQDMDGTEVIQSTPIGNGTKGHFQFNPVQTKNGLYCYPVAVCVTHLVPWEGGGSSVDDEALGLEELKVIDPSELNTEGDADYEDDVPLV